jgi:hypothetical protein
VVRVIDEVLESKEGNNCRIVEHLLSFAEHQLGKGVTGKHYREREDGERISNWIAEFDNLYRIIGRLANLHGQDKLLSTVVRDDMSFPYLEQSLSLLNLWMINLDLDARKSINNLNEDPIKDLLIFLFYTEYNMALITMRRRQFDLAEVHCQRCLAYSRRYRLEGKEKFTMIFNALKNSWSLQSQQGNYSDALPLA